MLLSVICPVYNEQCHIEQLVRFFLNSNPPDKELFLIDGGSSDGTQESILTLTRQHHNIHLLHNPQKYVPFALNLAIPRCTGRYIVRLDAHSEYAPDYFEKVVETFQDTGADIVGGPTGTKGLSAFQSAVARAISTPFGIGNSKVHDITYKGYTDSVTFGAWKKEVFQALGGFDTQLIRNQDDEFHYRAKDKGLKIFQNPDIRLYYYPRDTVKGLFSQYFQYGYYKPLVLQKIPSGRQWRHLIPAFFVVYLLLLTPGMFINRLFVVPLLVYGVFDVVSAFWPRHLPWASKWSCLLVYPVIHVAYGLGFLIGVLNKPR